ncbi:MAG: glycosyltransferase family 39 protein, partial [Rhodoferax sp.]|nr:glycosyltransferase family 39 protein [Rhodoferax sp.]
MQVAVLLLGFTIAWSLAILLTSLSPPTDNIEQLNWVHRLDWGYYKHPPLPTWLLWLPTQLLGATAATSHAMGIGTNLVSLGLFWWLLKRLRGAHHATLALLAVLCITYYNNRLPVYNHNTVLMLVSTACAALTWKAMHGDRIRWWLALGLALGLGALTKYQIGVTATSVLAFWLAQRGWRNPAQRRGLLLAVLLALLVFAPHLQWLRTHDFGPVAYALDSSLGARLAPDERVLDAGNWLADQLLNRSLASWVLLMLCARAAIRCRAAPRPAPDAARQLLWCWGLVPLAFMPVVGLAAGSRLHMPWGTPFLLFAIPAVMELLRPRCTWDRVPLRPALGWFILLQAALLLASLLSSPKGP